MDDGNGWNITVPSNSNARIQLVFREAHFMETFYFSDEIS